MHQALPLLALLACGRDHFDPTHNTAFVTSTVHDPTTFGSDLAAADAICMARATDAGLLGPYAALVWTQDVDATTRLGNARGWVRVDGVSVVDTIDDVGLGRWLHPLAVDELGEPVHEGLVVTGAPVPNQGIYT